MRVSSAGVIFWATLGLLALGVLVLAVLGLWRVSGVGPPATERHTRLPVELLHALEQRARIHRVVDESLCGAARAHMREQVARQVEVVFAPVYARIPELADWHYSVAGEYVELGQAAAGHLAAAWERRLFRGADLERRLPHVLQALDAELAGTLRAGERRLRVALPAALGSSTPALGPLLDHVLAPLRDDIRQRTELQMAKVGALGGALAVRKLLITLAGKTLAAAGTKLALKTGSKWAASAAGGAGAAALCSVVPVVGTAVCGVGGALAAWFAIDALAVNVDEALHRAAFESELRAAVDEARARTAATILALYTERIDGLCARVRGRIREMDEQTLLRRLNRSPYAQIREHAR